MPASEPIKPISSGIGAFAFRVIKLCLIFSGISLFAAIIMGSSTVDVKQETTNNKSFVKVAKEMTPNFEESLSLYTGDTQKIVKYLLSLRPSTEEEFITFISKIEDLGQELSLNLNIKSIESVVENTGKKPSKKSLPSIGYQVSFYGSIRDMKSFIKNLDDLPYYIEVSEIKYSNPAFTDDLDVSNAPNISISIKLFTKN